ncbi:MAG: hypothetical protein IT424_08035 [Pirellulales bacterium]|nr:hypothetical protein [Pirellulales bacterium]
MPAMRVFAAQYNEFVQGDLSGDGAAPSVLALGEGSNLLVAQSSRIDDDFLKIVLPLNLVVDRVTVEFHMDPDQIFFGLQAGATWTAGDAEIDPSQLVGWVDFPTDPGAAHTGEDILDDLGFAPGAIGFVPPLSSGTYTALFRAPSTAIDFALDFHVSSLTSGLPGDFNRDGSVNQTDLAIWQQAVGGGTLGGNDFLIWQRNLGRQASTMAGTITVPEAPAGLLAAGSLISIMRQRRRSGRYRRRAGNSLHGTF